MNIFALDRDPELAAQYHFDVHMSKMCIEYAQLLSTAHHFTCSPIREQCYRATHKNHPSAKWARHSADNYEWLYQLFIATCNEYKYRYGREHLTHAKLANVLTQAPPALKSTGLTPVLQAMPDEFKLDPVDFDASVQAYRAYYKHGKPNLPHRWTKRSTPPFMN